MWEILTTQKEKVETKELSEQDKKKEIFLLEQAKQKIWKIKIQEVKNKLKELEENKQMEQELGIFDENEYNKQKELLEKALNENVETTQLNEVLNKIEKRNKNLKKYFLLEKIANVYEWYLKSIYDNIQVKWLSDKDERYLAHIKIIKKELIRIKYFKLKQWENINQYIERIFKSEEKLWSGSLWNPFLFVWKDGKILSYESPFKITEQVNQDYKNIISMIQNFEWGKQEMKQIEIKIYKLFRKNDHYDETYNLYNSWNAISANIINDVLENKEINKNEKIRKLKEIFKNLSWRDLQNVSKEEFKKLIWEENIVSEDIIDKIYENIEEIKNVKEKLKKQMKDKLKEELKLKYEVWIEEWQVEKISEKELENNIEQISQEIVNKNFESFLELALESVIKKWLLDEILQTEEIKTNNEIVKMYENINGIWENVADETVNKIVNGTEIFVEFLLTMYVGWLLAWMAREVSIWKIINYWDKLWLSEKTILTYEWMYETLNPVEKIKTLKLLYKQDAIQLAKMLGIDIGLLTIEWTTFWLALQWVKNVKYWEKIEDLTNIDINTISRVILFLWIIKALSVNIWKEWIRNKYLREWINLTLDTTALVWTDTAVKIILNEKLPKTEKQITEYLFKELEEIIPLLIWIKAMNKWQVIVIDLQNRKIKAGEKEYDFEKAKRFAKEENGIKERENADYEVNTKLYEIENMTLEDVLLWEDKKTLSEEFQDLLNNNHTEQELINLWNNKLEKIVKKKIEELWIKMEDLSFKDIWEISKHIKELKKDYEQAIKERIKMEQWEIKRLSEKYGDPEIVAKLLDRLIRGSLKKEVLNKLEYGKKKINRKKKYNKL